MPTETLISLKSLFGSEDAERYHVYICPECDEVLKDAVQFVNCGHFLCEDCAGVAIYKHKERARCPRADCVEFLHCDKGIDYFPNGHLRQKADEINKVQTECPVTGCEWIGLYKDFKVHRQDQHPSALWQSMPKRRAPRAVVAIPSHDETCQPKIMPEQLPDASSESKRLKANSLLTSQKKAGAEASSNQSLKRASEPKLFQGQSDTLDASAANVPQMRFETTPEVEVRCEEEDLKNGKQQLVHGSSKKPSHRQNPSDVIPKPPFKLTPAVAETGFVPSTNGSASASSPRKQNRHRISPPTGAPPPQSPKPTTSSPPHSPRAIIVPTLNTLSSMAKIPFPAISQASKTKEDPRPSPTAQVQLHVPPIPQASRTEQDSSVTPTHIPPPSILNSSRTPVPTVFRKNTTTNSMPQDSKVCCQCKQKDQQLVVLQKTVKELLNVIVSPTCNTTEKNVFRQRIMSN